MQWADSLPPDRFWPALVIVWFVSMVAIWRACAFMHRLRRIVRDARGES